MPEIGSLYVGLGFDTAVFDRQIPLIGQRAEDASRRVTRAFGSASTSLDQFQRNARQTTFAVTQLSFQLNDIATQFASGASPFRVLANQSGHVIQAFQQGGGVRNVLGGAATALRGMITPATAAAAGIGAVAVGIGVLTARALESTSALRQFNVMLKGFGVEGQATAAGLEAAAKRLRDVGLTAADARTALRGAVRAGVSPGAAERVVRTGQNLVPVLGDDAPQQLSGAITGGVDSLSKLALQLGVVTEREVAAAREAAKFGMEMQHLDRWFRLIEQRAEGLSKEALSPMAQAMRDVRINIAEMLDSASRSDLIMGIVNGMNALAKALKAVFELQPPDWFNKLMGVQGAREFRAAIPPASGASGASGVGDVERTLDLIEQHESGGRNIHQGVVSKSISTAQGNFQITNSTWRDFAREAGVDLGMYPNAMSAPYDVQRQMARTILNSPRGGVGRWANYNPALRAAIGGGGGSLLARPGASQDAFMAGRATEFESSFALAQGEIAADRFIGLGYRTGTGRIAEAGAQATLERMQRYGAAAEAPQAAEEARKRNAQLVDATRARQERRFGEQSQEDREHSDQLRLQVELQGKSTEHIDRQVALLKVRQQAEAAGLDLTNEAVEAREREVNALHDAMDQLARQRALMDQIREVGGVFENTFSRAFDSITEGTFKVREALGGLLRDLGKTLASQAFRALLHGDTGSGGGFLGSILGLFSGGIINGGQVDFGGGGDLIPAFADGGSFRVGGSGGIDSQLVQFWASPDERVRVDPPGGGGGEVIRIELNPNNAFIAGIADQQIVSRTGTIVQLSVAQSTKAVQRNWSGMSSEASQRQL